MLYVASTTTASSATAGTAISHCDRKGAGERGQHRPRDQQQERRPRRREQACVVDGDGSPDDESRERPDHQAGEPEPVRHGVCG